MNRAEANICVMLARVIGWPEVHLAKYKEDDLTCVPFVFVGERIRHFDYRDPLVIWPIAVKYRCFPDCYYENDGKFTHAHAYEARAWTPGAKLEKVGAGGPLVKADTPELAVAHAVISLHMQLNQESKSAQQKGSSQ